MGKRRSRLAGLLMTLMPRPARFFLVLVVDVALLLLVARLTHGTAQRLWVAAGLVVCSGTSVPLMYVQIRVRRR